MVTVMVSKWVGDAFDKDSIYDALIDLNQYPFLDSKREYYSDAIVSDIMTKEDNIVVIPAIGFTVNDLGNFSFNVRNINNNNIFYYFIHIYFISFSFCYIYINKRKYITGVSISRFSNCK